MRTQIMWLITGISLLMVPYTLRADDDTRPAKRQSSKRPKLVILSAEREYQTEKTLPLFAKANLAKDFRVQLLFADTHDPNSIPGIEAVQRAQVLLVSVRRRTLPNDQLAIIHHYVQSGRPVVGIRTASHAFCLRNAKPEPGHGQWPEFDQTVLGGNYHDHYGNKATASVQAVPHAFTHPIMQGVGHDRFSVFGSLYKTSPLAKSSRLLMTGRIDITMTPEPVAWTHTSPAGGRVFYTSLGHPRDFELPDFVRLLRNGIYWAAGLAVPTTEVICLAENAQTK